jgi:hypothetical protein
VGPDKVVAVLGEEGAPDVLLRSFETLAGIRAGTLRLGPNLNRSFTAGEAELVRLVNREAARRNLSDKRYAREVRTNLCYRLTTRVPAHDEARLRTPKWALEEIASKQESVISAIDHLGIRVLGDVTSYVRTVPRIACRSSPRTTCLRASHSFRRSHTTMPCSTQQRPSTSRLPVEQSGGA